MDHLGHSINGSLIIPEEQSIFDCIPFADHLTTVPPLNYYSDQYQMDDALVPLLDSMDDLFLQPLVPDNYYPQPSPLMSELSFDDDINMDYYSYHSLKCNGTVSNHANIIDTVPFISSGDDANITETMPLISNGDIQELKDDDTETRYKNNAVNGRGSKLGEMGIEELRSYFYMPITRAAKELNVGLTLLKKRCRELGIPRWPHRKMKSLNTLIHNVQELGKGSNDECVKRELESLEEHRRLMEENPEIQLTESTKKLRQACFKANYKMKRAMQHQQYSYHHPYATSFY